MKSDTIFHYAVAICLLCIPLGSYGQAEQEPYLFPIKPGQRNYLAGTMAELRANHFHGGLDIKTEGTVGLPVYAAADGYVTRIKVSSYGYGNVLYLRHPNGEYTVYAHLRNFRKDIHEYMLNKHYELESFEVDVAVKQNTFPVKRGDIIAYSGNSGSSGGPHLHFEIRNKNEEPVNPLDYNFSEIVDNLNPVINKVAVQSLAVNSRVEGQFGRSTYSVYGSGSTYKLRKSIAALGKVGVSFKGIDRANGTYNKYGINTVEMYVNGKLHYKHHLNAIPFHLNRGMHMFTHYPSWALNREKFQRCYKADGNPLPIFGAPDLHGVINVKEGSVYQVEIRLYDSQKNRSTVQLMLEGKGVKPKTSVTKEGLIIEEEIVKLTVNAKADTAFFIFDYEAVKVPLAYQHGDTKIFLWDLRRGLPQKIVVDGKSHETNFQMAVYPGQSLNLFHEKAEIFFPANALFDTLHFSMHTENKSLHLGESTTPLFRPIEVLWTPEFPLSDTEKLNVFTRNRRGRLTFVGGKWIGNSILFSTNTLGEFFLSTEEDKPEIRLMSRGARQLMFTIDDKTSGVQSYRAELNGKFLLMRYDHKRNLLWADLGDAHQAIKGDFRLVVTDEHGYTAEYKRRF